MWRPSLALMPPPATERGTAAHDNIGGIYATHNIHVTHIVVAVRNILYCRRCGYWTQHICEKLRDPCPGAPSHSNNSSQLLRLNRGMYPRRKDRADGTPGHHIFPVTQLTHRVTIRPD